MELNKYKKWESRFMDSELTVFELCTGFDYRTSAAWLRVGWGVTLAAKGCLFTNIG